MKHSAHLDPRQSYPVRPRRKPKQETSELGLSAQHYTSLRRTVASELQLGLSRLDDNKPLASQAQFDQLSVVEVILRIEERFEFEIKDADLVRILGTDDLEALRKTLTVRKLAEVVAKKLAERKTQTHAAGQYTKDVD